jgi:hypothetical protein
MPIIPATQEAEIRWISVPSQPGQIDLMTLSQKNTSQKRARGMIQEVRVPKHKALSSNPSATKKKKKPSMRVRTMSTFVHLKISALLCLAHYRCLINVSRMPK